MKKEISIEQAKETLKNAGYFVDNLWHIDDVKVRFKCTDKEAYELLGDVLRGAMEGINIDIENIGFMNYERIED